MGPKKKKAKGGLARPIATMSIASKPRVEATEGAIEAEDLGSRKPTGDEMAIDNSNQAKDVATITCSASDANPQLSPEEFERQLEESELQLLVEKHAQKVRRDVQRQKQRLETDRRLLRSQATPINTVKWLPPDLMDQIMDLIQAENRFTATSLPSETAGTGKMPLEEEVTIRLWTLQHTLLTLGFPEMKAQSALRYVLEIVKSIQAPAKDSIWGLEEALSWLARECTTYELPDYDSRPKTGSKVHVTPLDTPESSRPHTPTMRLDTESGKRFKVQKQSKASSKKKVAITCDSDIEPDQLEPEWLQTKEKMLSLERARQENIDDVGNANREENDELELEKLQARLAKIENDVLFDKFTAEQAWRARRIVLEKDIAQARRLKVKDKGKGKALTTVNVVDDVNSEAERIAADLLVEAGDDQDVDLAGLFASLPVSEVDETTGKTGTMITSADGVKIKMRDFGKWSGMSPMRVLDEACRSRDGSVRIIYSLVLETSFANRHRVSINWSKAQEILPEPEMSDVDVYTHPLQYIFTMSTIATPDVKQSEAFAATFALFHIFGASQKEEKVFMRLPAVWREYWSELASAKKNLSDARDRAEIQVLREMVRKRQDQEDEDGIILSSAFRGRGVTRGIGDSNEDASQERVARAIASPEYFQKIWNGKISSRKYQNMLQSRMMLPMWTFKHQVVEAVDSNQVVIICGETGCGKSTQTPAFLLEHQLSQGKHCKIYCTEPRRISALSLARRVSEELGENKGDLGTSRSLVGYSIRLESNTCRETRLVYATTGIIMRMLESSTDLQEITHLVLDEVHERSIDSDFLLIVLKRLMVKRQDLRIVLMSATVDAERFSKYLGDAPVLNVPGRTFPVQVKYLEDAVELTGYQAVDTVPDRMVDLDDDAPEEDSKPDAKSDSIRSLAQYSTKTRSTLAQLDEYRIEFDLVVQLIYQIATQDTLVSFSQAILVFLPGIAEIRTINDMLLGHPFFMSGWFVYPLHSSIATEDQEAAFHIPPQGCRKIVLATNIAETGITIPDVTCVVDTGKHKEMRFDERRQLSRLVDTFISRSNAKQRRGRAGRVQEGLCFHMFTKYRHDNLINEQQTPEMLRLSLQDLAIRVKVCKIGGIEETLSEALDAPSAKNIRRAVDALIDVRALTQGEELTPLGNQLARLPLDVFLGKLILLGTVFKCLDMAITVAAILSSKTPFSAPFGQRTQANTARLSFRRADSDLLTVYNAYLAWKRVCQSGGGGGKEFQFCRKNFLSQQTLSNIEDLKGQLLVALVDSGFLPLTEQERQMLSRLRFGIRGRRQQIFFEMPQRVNINSENDAITSSVITWSFYPKLLVREAPGSKGLRNVANNQSITLHPTSVNRGRPDIEWLAYYHIMQAKQAYHAHETTAAEAIAIALLCGDVRCEPYAGVFVLDGNRGKFSVPDWKTMLVIKVLRTRLREMLTRAFKQPGKTITQQHQRWLEIWQKIFTPETKDSVVAVSVSVG